MTAQHAEPGPVRRLLLTEPVRLYLGGVLAAVVALLGAYGVLDGETAAVWLAVGTAVLGVPAVEGARARVMPMHRVVGVAERSARAGWPLLGADTPRLPDPPEL